MKMCLINGSLDLDMSISMCLWNCPNGWAAHKNRDGIAAILLKGDTEAVRMFPSVSEKGKRPGRSSEKPCLWA